MNNKRIGLYGIEGLYNYGCEAIVRGTVYLLRKANPDADIVYFTPRKTEDECIIRDLKISVCQLNRKEKTFFIRACNKGLRFIKSSYQLWMEDYNTVLSGCDILISIGGDIYTIPEVKRNKTSYYYGNRLVNVGKKILNHNKKEIIMGASVGPFGNYDKAVNYYKAHLSKVDLIMNREETSVDYLRQIGISDNLMFFPDPAFFVQCNENSEKNIEKKYIGINLSPLSLIELYGEITEQREMQFVELIEEIIEKYKHPVLLIPHVISENVNDNDKWFLNRLQTKLSPKYRDRCQIVEADGFLGTKKYLRQCHMVIAARMHCAVNAICEGVPTLFLSYSNKSIGMCRFVYGNNDYVVLLKKTDEMMEYVDKVFNKKDEINIYLKKKVGEIRKVYCNKQILDRFIEIVG